MNGFADQGLSEDNFGPSSGLSALRSFDAFPKTKTTYLTTTRNGAFYTIVLAAVCVWLTTTEIWRWTVGTTTHTFSIEKGIDHDLQINIDIIVAMQCNDLHVNVQDASGDRILAGDKLHRDPTMWRDWHSERQVKQLGQNFGKETFDQYRKDQDVHEFLAKARGKKTYIKTPSIKAGRKPDSCRLYGSIDSNKVQGDFHITARGHGYAAMGDHLDHKTFNFSHHINELSFGAYFPALINPLDETTTMTDFHFYKYQYYLSVVPTIYTDRAHRLTTTTPPKLGTGNALKNIYALAPHTMFTNQYAVTEQSHTVGEQAVPGVFMKYDIEPILLTVAEEWGGFLGLIVKIVNVIAGVMVAGGWLVSLGEWAVDSGFLGRISKRRMAGGEGGLLAGSKRV